MAEKKRIAIFHCGFIYSGGGERLIIEEAKGLIKRGYIVDIFVPTVDRELCYPDQLRSLTVKTFLPQLPSFVPAKHALEMIFSSIFAPLYAFRFRRYDAILGANQPGAWIAYCVSKILGKPYIVYMNQPNRLLYPRKIDIDVKWQNLKEYYYIDKFIKRFPFFVVWADKVSCTGGKEILVNGAYIGEIIKKIYGKPVKVCPAGAYVQPFSLLRVNPHTAYKGRFVIGNKEGKKFDMVKPYILITNRHQPQKRFDLGLYAFEKIVKLFPELKLVIPGPFTDETGKLKKLASELGIEGQVIFTGQISEDVLQKLYREAVVYWYTAPEEDFGMGIIEAMGWGVPVVAWKHAGPTVTVVDGVTGYLAKPYDVDDFMKKTIEVIRVYEERAEMGKRAWRRVAEQFTWEKHADIIEREIASVV
jgi:glycosyltransferase involved in cell wall biosynthesis